MRALSRTGVRFGLETVLIVATAIVTGVLHLGATVIIGSVVVAWVATSVFEYSRAHPRAVGRAVGGRRAAEDGDELVPEPSIAFEHVRVLPAARRVVDPELQAEQVVVLEPEAVFVPEVEPEPDPGPEPALEPEPEPVVAEAPTEVVRAVLGEPEPEPDRERVVAAAPASTATVPVAVEAPAVAWPQRSAEAAPEPLPVTTAPWSWNVWNLERVVRERDASNEELQFLLLYLRDYASPSGMLPPDFDGLVRESFGDLLAAPS
jgi:hypothetical protein